LQYRAATGEPQRPDGGDGLDRHQRVKRLACGAGDAEQGGVQQVGPGVLGRQSEASNHTSSGYSAGAGW
jgi:hypothetical protein